MLKSLCAVPGRVRTSVSEATATSSNVLLGPSQAASEVPDAEAAQQQGSEHGGAQAAH